jgi:hypothetical protein
VIGFSECSRPPTSGGFAFVAAQDGVRCIFNPIQDRLAPRLSPAFELFVGRSEIRLPSHIFLWRFCHGSLLLRHEIIEPCGRFGNCQAWFRALDSRFSFYKVARQRVLPAWHGNPITHQASA